MSSHLFQKYMYATGLKKKDHFTHFGMHMLQRCVFLLRNVQSKLNVEYLQRSHYCSSDAEMKP